MSTRTWIGLGIGVAVAATVGLAWWALRGGPPASVATSSAPAPGPAASSGTPVASGDPSRGPTQSAQSTGEKIVDFFTRGVTYLEGGT